MLYVKRPAVAIVLAFILILLTACSQAAPAQPVASSSDNSATLLQTGAEPASNPGAAPATADNVTASISPAEVPASQAGPPVQIIAVHARGTLNPMGCCDRDLVETDEFVAVRNTSTSPQDIRGWTLKNITTGYPTFTFPNNFPCIARNVLPDDYPAVPGGYNTFSQITPQTVNNTFTTVHQGAGPLYSQGQIDWSQCSLQPLDDSPLKPTAGQQGSLPPCILYPGQTVLVFTDEIHCQYGGLSFNYGQGDIWNNAFTDIAVLYDAQGHEVSRKSYDTGK
jgi:hypothetical protein